ncbi:DNA-packaging protein [Octadecabacter sp. G9-8]|uniref:DNA-packaging protein n=1 Tax=Octadecabacter dasysiphoniae TaxID=2909341 RepID=A0ABS9CZH0_9RHOB|nr:DNA-packaging protein [Octadecabacter dasysiphoniae]MCF2872675.1 DNA-packaging protein [Octadecabacter dasysiphoniae]
MDPISEPPKPPAWTLPVTRDVVQARIRASINQQKIDDAAGHRLVAALSDAAADALAADPQSEGVQLWHLPKQFPKPERCPFTGQYRPGVSGCPDGGGLFAKTPEELWMKCVRYFEWASGNPLIEAKHHAYEGEADLADVPHVRLFTKTALYAFIDLSKTAWLNWGNKESNQYRPDLVPVMELVDQIIWDQKFTNAAAGLAHAGLVIADLNKMKVGDTTMASVAVDEVQISFVSASEKAILYHPDDLHLEGPLFTQSQLEAGVKWSAPT